MQDYRMNTFLALCETLNYTRTAEQLHITQPAVTQHIHFLEQQYGVPLLECVGKRARLTAAGEELYRAARVQRSDEELLRKRMAQGKQAQLPLALGATKTIGECAAAQPVAAYLRKHPQAQVRMEIGNTDELLHRLRDGTLNFALVEGYFDRALFDSLTFRTEPFVPVCAAKHRFACGHVPHTLQDLLPERILAREEGSGTRDILEKNLAAHSLRLQDFAQIAQLGSVHIILQLLALDAGVSFMYRIAAASQIADGVLREIPLRDFSARHDFAFVWLRGSVYAQDIRAVCQEMCAALPTPPAP